MSNLNEDPLAGLYVDEQQSEQDDPLAGLYVDEETGQKKEEPYRDVVSEELRSKGYEPDFSEELERAYGYGSAEGVRGLASGATLGLSEKVPGLETKGNAASVTGELVGSVLPIEFMINAFGKPLTKIAQKSPYFKKSLETLANLTGVGLGGAVYGGTKQAIEKDEIPSANDVLEHGTEWAMIDAALRATGATGTFAVNLVKAARKTGKPEYKVLNDVYTDLINQGIDVGKDKRVGTKALSIIEDIAEGKVAEGGKDRIVKPEKFKEMDNSIESLSEPILPEAPKESLNVNSMVESAEQEAIRNRIDSVGHRAIEDAELGKDIQEGINTAKEQAKSEYKPFYDEVEEGARFITTNPKSTAETAGNLIDLIEELKTKPAGYSTVIKNLETVLEDIGYKIQRNESGAIESIIQEKEVGLNKLMELGRRLNEVVEYDVLDKTVKGKINPIAKAVKADIRTALGKVDEDLLAAFELAEQSFAKTAQKFGRDSIRKIRSTEALEAIPKHIESSTALKDLREILPEKQMKNIERQVLEKLNGMKEAQAQDFFRKVRSGLSKDSQSLAEDIIKSKKPINKQSIQGRNERLHEAIDEELINSMNTGKRPKKTLELWQNPRGQKLVRESLESSPQKKELLEYLQKQTLQDMAHSIVGKDGGIDFTKLNELLKNPSIKNNLRELGGKEAVDFFEQLSRRAENLKKNAAELVTEKLGTQKGQKLNIEPSNKEKGKQILKRMAKKDYPIASAIQKALDTVGFTGKISLNLFTLIKFGFIKGALIPIAGRLIQKMASSSKVRKAFIDASKHHTDPLAFIAAIEHLGNTIDEED